MDPDGREYLSGINCGAEVAQQSFMATKNLYSKASGTFFYHYVQSFSPQENVTPAQAHQIALELAERFFPVARCWWPPMWMRNTPTPTSWSTRPPGHREEAPLYA